MIPLPSLTGGRSREHSRLAKASVENINALGPDTEKCETYDNVEWKETEPLLTRFGHATVTIDDYELNFKDFFE